MDVNLRPVTVLVSGVGNFDPTSLAVGVGVATMGLDSFIFASGVVQPSLLTVWDSIAGFVVEVVAVNTDVVVVVPQNASTSIWVLGQSHSQDGQQDKDLRKQRNSTKKWILNYWGRTYATFLSFQFYVHWYW